MSDQPTGVLVLIFVAAAVVRWIADIALAPATDVIDDAYGLGEALGGTILLSIVGRQQERMRKIRAMAAVIHAIEDM